MATLGYSSFFPVDAGYTFLQSRIALIGPNRAAPFFHLVVFGRRWRSCCRRAAAADHLAGYALVLPAWDAVPAGLRREGVDFVSRAG